MKQDWDTLRYSATWPNVIDDYSSFILTSSHRVILIFKTIGEAPFLVSRYQWSLISMNIFTDNFWYRRCFNRSLIAPWGTFSEYCLYRCWYCRTVLMAVCRMLVSAARWMMNHALWWLWTRFRLILKQHWKQLHQTYRRGCVRFCAVSVLYCVVMCCIYIHRALHYTCSRSLRDTALLQVMSSPPEQILPLPLNIHQHN